MRIRLAIRREPFRRSSAVEQLTVNQLVVGSIPTAGANFLTKYQLFSDTFEGRYFLVLWQKATNFW